ncbi:MAG TPA: 2-oxo acid dehydrogenase subunit E2, partial [Solirubrobacteraceae bacterium]|nr:2-oxo acid dehydrogenase subunit E2 [Solirubrobacteraceae bacterium]
MAVDTSTIQIVMPAMGDSVAEGTVLEWRKQEGDTVEIDETIVEISTDKVDAEVPAPVAGTIVKILAAEGETVEVGTPLAEIVKSANADSIGGSGGASSATTTQSPLPVSAESPPATPQEALAGAATEAEGEAAVEALTGELIDIVTPTGGESVTEGTILEWSVKVGDRVADGDTVVEISTDKVDMELPAPASGTITEILAQEGETVTVGQVIARLTATASRSLPSSPGGELAGAAATAAPAAPPAPSAPADIPASPVARRVAAADGVDLAGVRGSARGGRITKADVMRAAEAASVTAAGGGNGASATVSPEASRTQLKGGAAALARYMEESRQIPTATSLRTLTVTVLDQRRRQLKEAGQRVSYTHLIAYAMAVAASERMPVMAHHYDAVDGKGFRVDDGAVNLGLAVDVEKKDGTRTLMVPVIRDAGRLDFAAFLAAYNALVEKARTNTLTADDLSGANITLTNPGGLGTVASVPRLMSGQGTILATGSIAYPVGLGNIGEMIGAEKVMTMTSTYDHRIIQGAESGRFLQVLESYLQGEESFYERVFGDLGVALPGLPPPPAPAAAAAAAATARPTSSPSGELASDREAVAELLQAVQAATSLLKAHRTHGHLAAHLDPLGSAPEGDPALDPEQLDLTPELMARIPAHILRMYVPGATLADALPHLRETYCGPIAYEIEHIASHEQRLWLRERIESGEYRAPLRTEEQKALLRRLTQVDALERFMHKAYLGQKQFSIEGLDMTVPMLDETIQLAAGHGA